MEISDFPRMLGNYTHAHTSGIRRSFPTAERLGTRLMEMYELHHIWVETVYLVVTTSFTCLRSGAKQ